MKSQYKDTIRSLPSTYSKRQSTTRRQSNLQFSKQKQQSSFYQQKKSGICDGQGNFNSSFGSGRSKYVILYVVCRFVFKLVWGLFDEVSDWWYYIDAARNNKFQDENLENLMIFFLCAQFGVQIIAWMIIFGGLKVKDVKRNTGKSLLYDIDEETKLEIDFRKLPKVLYFTIYNFVVQVIYILKSLPESIFMTLLQILKISPFVVHGYFQKKFKTVITDSFFNKLTEKKSILRKKNFDFQRFQDSKMVLDANIKPNFTTFLFETDLERYLRMSDTMEAIFEALPMAILQFLNNQHIYGRVADWGLQNQLFFLSSFFTVLIYTITLIQYLFSSDSEILWNLSAQMKRLKEQGEIEIRDIQSKAQYKTFDRIQKEDLRKKKYLFNQLQFQKNLKIKKPKQLLKLQFCEAKGLIIIQDLNLSLNEYANDLKYNLEAIHQLFPKLINLQKIKIRFEKCHVRLEKFAFIFKELKNLQSLREIQLDLGFNKELLQQVGHKDNESLKNAIFENYLDLDHNKITLNLNDTNINVGERLNFIFELIDFNQSCEAVSINLKNNQINEINIDKLAQMKHIKYDYIIQFDLDFSNNEISKLGQSKIISLILSGFQKTQKVVLNFSNQTKIINLHEINEDDLENHTDNKNINKITNYKISAEPDSQTQLQRSNSSQNQLNLNENENKNKENLQQNNDNNTKTDKSDIEINDNNRSQQFIIMLPQSHSLFLYLKQLSFDFENCQFDDNQLDELSTKVLFQLRVLQELELNLSFNNITDVGLQKLGKNGIKHLTKLEFLKIQVQSQNSNQITHNGIQQLSADILGIITGKHLNKIEFDFRNNEAIKGTLFYQNRILFQQSNILEDSKIINQIQNALASEGETINFSTIKLPSNNIVEQSNFTLKEQFWINFEQNQIVKPLYDQQKDIISISNIQKFRSPNQVTFGRPGNERQAPDFDFKKDQSVSKTQGIMTFQKNNDKNNYFYQCKAGFSNATSFRIAKKAYYQLFQHCIITLGRGQFQVTIEIGKIGKNDVITKDDQQQWQGRSSKSSYFWDWVDEEELEPDSDVTMNSDIEEQKQEDEVDLDNDQIQIKVLNPTESGRKVFQKFTIFENFNQLEQDPQENEEIIFGQSISVGTNRSCGIVLNPSIYQDFLAEVHCYIGRKRLGDKNDANRKQFWYIRVDDVDIETQETFLSMQRNHNSYTKNPVFPLYNNMEINLGFTVFRVNFLEKLKQQIQKEKEKEKDQQKKTKNQIIKEMKTILDRQPTKNFN